MCVKFVELRKKMLEHGIESPQVTKYIMEICGVTATRARNLMKREKFWNFNEASALSDALSIPRARWADYFFPEEDL